MNLDRTHISLPQSSTAVLRRAAPVVLGLALFALFAVPVVADILIMQDGSRLEIKGEWRDRGRVIEFTLPNGTLGSVRASEVDLEASGEATRLKNAPPVEEPKEEMPKERPAPVAVWTNDDIPQAPFDVLAGESAALDAKAVQVTDWRAEPGSDANIVTVIRGSVQNFGGNQITGLSLSVTVVGNRSGGAAPSLVRQASLDATDLGPGQTTEFSVEIRRGDVTAVGKVEEFSNPSATFEVLFSSNPTDFEGEGDEGSGESGSDEN